MVTFVNKLTVHGDPDAFLAVRARLTAYMSAQPGYISHQNLRALGQDNVHLEIAVWQSAEAHRAAVAGDGFAALIADLKLLVTAEPAMYVNDSADAPLEAAGVR
jgi:quinol monooxygenase YgiN